MYRINKSYIEKCLRIIEKSYKGIITQDLVYKSDVFLWLEV